jgi:hypothetical protein
MMTRREMFQVCAGLAASPAVLASADAPGIETRRRHVLRAVLVDRSNEARMFAEPVRVFAEAVRARGLAVHELGSDLGDVYTGELAPCWRREGAAPIAGLTAAAPLFYLERLAWDAGMRVVFLGRHVLESPMLHTVDGPRDAVDAFQVTARVIDWRIALANLLPALPASAPTLEPLSAVRDAFIGEDPALFSWVLAPVDRASRKVLR